MRDAAPEPSEVMSFPAELMIWLSPAFPIGSFAYSQGLEWAAASDAVTDAASLLAWLEDILQRGSLRNDLIVLSLTYRARDDASLADLAELSSAMQPSRERAEETWMQGRAFAAAYCAAWHHRPEAEQAGAHLSATLPVAVGCAARAHTLGLTPTLVAYATAFLSTLVSAAIRLSVVGQFDAQRVLAALLPLVRAECGLAATATMEDLGSATFAADLASIAHETQATRLFRS